MAGIVLAILALLLGIAAVPVAVGYGGNLAGAALAAGGVVFALWAVLKSLFRRGSFRLAAISLLVSGSALFSIVLMAHGPAALVQPAKDRLATLVDWKAPGSKGSHASAAPGANSPPLPETIAALVERLRSKDENEQLSAAAALGKMGDKARSAARALCEACTSKSEPVRRAALEALEQVDPAIYKQAVILLVDGDFNNHIRASQALAGMGGGGCAAIPVLVAHAKWTSTQPGFRDQLMIEDIAALAKLGPADPDVVRLFKQLAEAPREESRGVRLAAINAIMLATTAEPNLRAQFVQPLVNSIKMVNSSGRQVWDSPVAVRAIEVLASFGPDAKAAIPTLKLLKLDESMAIRQAALTALEEIDKTGSGSGGDGESPVSAAPIPPVKAAPAAPTDAPAVAFDLADLGRTLEWANLAMRELGSQQRNGIRYEAAVNHLKHELQKYAGKQVKWSMTAYVIEKSVVRLRAGDQNMVVSGPGPRTYPSTYWPLLLRVGADVSVEKAAALNPSDKLTIVAEIADIDVRRDSIGVWLKNLKADEGKAGVEGPARGR